MKEIHSKCIVVGILNKMVILDVKTRWNSTYEMLIRARELKEVSFFIFIFFNLL